MKQTGTTVMCWSTVLKDGRSFLLWCSFVEVGVLIAGLQVLLVVLSVDVVEATAEAEA